MFGRPAGSYFSSGRRTFSTYEAIKMMEMAFKIINLAETSCVLIYIANFL